MLNGMDELDLYGWMIEALKDHAEGCLACRFNFGSGKCSGCGRRYSGAPTAVMMPAAVPYVVHWCEDCLEAERQASGLDRLRFDSHA